MLRTIGKKTLESFPIVDITVRIEPLIERLRAIIRFPSPLLEPAQKWFSALGPFLQPLEPAPLDPNSVAIPQVLNLTFQISGYQTLKPSVQDEQEAAQLEWVLLPADDCCGTNPKWWVYSLWEGEDGWVWGVGGGDAEVWGAVGSDGQVYCQGVSNYIGGD